MRRSFVTRWLALAAVLLVSTVAVRGDLASELGQPSFPLTVAGSGSVVFDAGTRVLQVSAVTNRTFLTSEADLRNHAASPASSMVFSLSIDDAAGASVTGLGTPTLQMLGAFDVNGDGMVTADESGVLLTGDFVELAYKNPPPSPGNDQIAVRFAPTGGILAPFYAGRSIGVDVRMLNNGNWPIPGNPDEHFASSFSAPAAGVFVKPVFCGVQIGDFVWNDVDGDGVREPGEPGINGVTVRLRDEAGAIVATANTQRGPFNQGGFYRFERLVGLCAGTYTVEVDTSTLPAGYFPTVVGSPDADAATDSNPNPAVVAIATDAVIDHTIDFGFTSVYNGKISGRAWHDLNQDGLQADGEPGLNNVRVQVFDAADALMSSDLTDGSGQYEILGLLPGPYRVEVDGSTLPIGLVPTVSFAGPEDVDSNGSPADVTLDAFTRSAKHVDFGYVAACTGVIGDFVWHDRNQNGTQDAEDIGLAGVRVTLVSAAGQTLATTTSGPNGEYSFTGVCAGTYTVVIDPGDVPAGFTPAVKEFKPAGPELDSNTSPVAVVVVTDSSIDKTIDLGFVAQCTGNIGNRVWRDENANGIQDAGEGGMPGVTVNLRRRSDDTIIQSDVTDRDGLYGFEGLCPGDYVIEVVVPTDLGLSPSLKGAPDVDSNPNPTKITLALDNSSDPTIDFGVYVACTGEIGSRVWDDVNGDGIQNAGEPGIAGVIVELLNIATVGEQTTATDAQGDYRFTGLCAGEYRVKVIPPAGYRGPTLEGVGNDPGADSNPNASIVMLPTSSTKDTSIDFGFTNFVPPTPTTGLSLTKTANKHTVTFGESVTYTYVVSNTGTTPLLNVAIVDDNATPTFTGDDFTAGTVDVLGPGESKTFTKTLVPPAKMCNDTGGHPRKCGMLIVKHLGKYLKFIYLQAKDHRNDHHDWNGWWGGRSYSRKAKFRLIDKTGTLSMDTDAELGDGDGEEYENSFSVTVDADSVTKSDGSVQLPKVFHKKGWDGDWRQDWDFKFGDWFGWRTKWWDDDKWGHDNDGDYDWDNRPKQCATTSTNVAKATATVKDGLTLTVTDKETVSVVAPPPQVPYKTFTQGGWGAKPSGSNPGKFLADNFSRVYPSSGLIIGGYKTIKLTSAKAVEYFLPQGGTPAKLTRNYINPTDKVTVLAGQVLALKLNVDFSAAGRTRQGLGQLVVVSGELAGKTVSQVLAIGNQVLGGGSLPSGLTLSELNDILAKINENFDGGTHNNGYLAD